MENVPDIKKNLELNCLFLRARGYFRVSNTRGFSWQKGGGGWVCFGALATPWHGYDATTIWLFLRVTVADTPYDIILKEIGDKGPSQSRHRTVDSA